MIMYATTSLLESAADALVCPVNTVGVMGKGLAKAFAQRFPDLANDYAIQCALGRLRIGQMYFWRIPTDEPLIETNAPVETASSKSRRVVCLPTKMHWRNPARLEYVEKGLTLFVKHYAAFDLASAAFPQLGCGLGGLDWDTQVRSLMEHYLHPLPISVTIHVRDETLPALVVRARRETITDIGQLVVADTYLLKRYVHYGLLSQGQGGEFPIPKTVYASPGYNFADERARALAELRHLGKT